jgi:sigma-B regulation protein RsbU (phosphoserine phosphatase)
MTAQTASGWLVVCGALIVLAFAGFLVVWVQNRKFWDRAAIRSDSSGDPAGATISEQKNALQQASVRTKEANARLMDVVEHLPDGFALFDADDRLMISNSKWQDFYQYSDSDAAIGTSYDDLVRLDVERGIIAGDAEAGEEYLIGRYRYRHEKSGGFEVTLADGRSLVVRESDTSEGGRVGIHRDVSHRIRADVKLQEAYGIIKDQKDRMEEELNIGREIQMSMIPLGLPPFPEYNEIAISAALEPAREVGGDFYDFYFLDEERLCVCIGDVSGKGVPAALFMAMAKTLMKSRAYDDASTASIVTHVNDELSADNEKCMFVTIFAAIINIKSGEVLFTNAGHNPPYIKRRLGTLEALEQRHGPVVGVVDGMVYHEETERMAPGDVLVLFTDGVTEAMNSKSQLFSDQRYVKLLKQISDDTPEVIVANTLRAVKDFRGTAEQSDDITILAFEYIGTAATDTVAERQVIIKNELTDMLVADQKFEEFASAFDVPESVILKFKIIFDELLNNIISYAYSDDDVHDIEINMERVGHRLTVTVIDDGVPFNPLSESKPNTDLSLQDREVGGLGIHLVRNLVDDASYQRRIGKNVMTLVQNLD